MERLLPMTLESTMTGSWFRTPEILKLLPESPTGEISDAHRAEIEAAERRAIRDQVHPNGSALGLTQVSNGEQRKAGYTMYLPNRFSGFSKGEKSNMGFSQEMLTELTESNPMMVQGLNAASAAFAFPKIESKLSYHGEDRASAEARDAVRIAKEEGASRVFLPSASPGVTTIFFPRTPVYRDHLEYLFGVAGEVRKEYKAILEVEGATLQIDAPDLAMGKHLATTWDMDFYEALPHHVDAINEAVAGLPAERIRVHYCYGNYLGSHRFDADYARVLKELTRLKVGTVVGEFANPRHEGDVVALEAHAKEHGWPKGLKYAVGVIDVKTPFVETPETVAVRLERVAGIEQIGPERVLGGTDCGFETFVNFDNVTYAVGKQKLESLAKGARLASERLGVG